MERQIQQLHYPYHGSPGMAVLEISQPGHKLEMFLSHKSPSFPFPGEKEREEIQIRTFSMSSEISLLEIDCTYCENLQNNSIATESL